MIIHLIIIIKEAVRVPIVQINTCVKRTTVIHVFKNHLLLIPTFIAGAIKIQFFLVNSLKGLK